jgi:hypothetical protein
MTKWKLVPVEPDEQQIYAMRSAFYRVRRGGAGGQTIDACYQRENAPELAAYSAMLEAAPQPPKLSDERIREIWIEHGLDDDDVEGFARAIEREILGTE